jgi:hypothetical protein
MALGYRDLSHLAIDREAPSSDRSMCCRSIRIDSFGGKQIATGVSCLCLASRYYPDQFRNIALNERFCSIFSQSVLKSTEKPTARFLTLRQL